MTDLLRSTPVSVPTSTLYDTTGTAAARTAAANAKAATAEAATSAVAASEDVHAACKSNSSLMTQVLDMFV
jgi:hypothetical protein